MSTGYETSLCAQSKTKSDLRHEGWKRLLMHRHSRTSELDSDREVSSLIVNAIR
jgi:hypothetical protein